MFAARTIRPAVAVARTQAVHQQQAGMATLKEIDQRLKSVRNIGKITKVCYPVNNEDVEGGQDVRNASVGENQSPRMQAGCVGDWKGEKRGD